VNKVILKWQRPLWDGDQEVVERSGRDGLMWVSIHKCMETTLGIFLSQTSKSIISFLLSPMFSLQQNQRIGWNTFYKEVEGAEWGGGPNNVYIYK
jgi:hypothetical protein